MAELHLFFPQNDLALANNTRGYSPPRAALDLCLAGRALPLWYGREGDQALCSGLNAEWLRRMAGSFRLAVEPFDGHARPELEAAPWGWSPASRYAYECAGYDRAWLPTDAQIQALRLLSHRRTCASVAAELQQLLPSEPILADCEEAFTLQAVEDFGRQHPQGIVMKSPWSCSGRGVFMGVGDTGKRQQIAADVLRRQGSVMLEPQYAPLLEFAMLYECRGGECAFVGTSAYSTDGHGHYQSNLLAPEDERRAAAAQHFDFDAVAEGLRQVLQRQVAPLYSGPLGVDMLIDRRGMLALLEINLRMTMGHVANRIQAMHLAPAARGSYAVLPGGRQCCAPVFDADGHLCSGAINLAPPDSRFSFVIEIS